MHASGSPVTRQPVPDFFDEDVNPCMKEQTLAYKCMDKNDYQKEACHLFFENYKICKQFWAYVERDRFRRGIVPALPLPTDRARIKREYMAAQDQARMNHRNRR